MNASYIAYYPEQQQLLPSALQDWVPQGHLAYFIPENASITKHQLGAVIDAGACSLTPTTVIDMSQDEPEVLRHGQGDPARLGL